MKETAGGRLLQLFSLDTPGGRKPELDRMRGFAMLLVILHHSGCWLADGILAFHMPLMFFLSGYAYALVGFRRDRSAGSFIRLKARRLLVPYFFFEAVNLLLSLLVSPVMHYSIDLRSALVSILTCINTKAYQGITLRLWFLPCIFWAEILFFLVMKVFGSRRAVLISGLVSLAVSFLLRFLPVERLPFAVDIAWMAYFWIAAGYVMGNSLERLSGRWNMVQRILCALCCAAVIALVYRLNSSVLLMYIDVYGNYFLMLAGAFAGILLFFLNQDLVERCCRKVQALSKLFSWLGFNSLCVFPGHLIVIWFVVSAQSFLLHRRIWPVTALLTLALTIPFVNWISTRFPAAAGRR